MKRGRTQPSANMTALNSCHLTPPPSLACQSKIPAPTPVILTHFRQQKRNKEWKKVMLSPFKDTSSKLPTTLLLASHWPELNWIATPSCKGSWEM